MHCHDFNGGVHSCKDSFHVEFGIFQRLFLMYFSHAFVTAFTCTVLHYMCIMNFIKDYFDNFISI